MIRINNIRLKKMMKNKKSKKRGREKIYKAKVF
jgi:hypothetical protein